MDEASHRADEALRLSRARGQRGYEALALYVLGLIESRRERRATAAAVTFYREAMALADELGMRPLADRCRAALDQPGG